MVVVILWLVVGLGLALTFKLTYQALWIMALYIYAAYALAGVLILIHAGILAFHRAWRPLAVMVAGTAVLMLAPLPLVGEWVEFRLREAEFRAAVQALEQPGQPAWRTVEVGRVRGWSDGQDLIALEWINGVPDGGAAILYDPNGRLIDYEPGRDRALDVRLGRLVYGQPSGCFSLFGPYRRCGYG